jgi:hypothetical protein
VAGRSTESLDVTMAERVDMSEDGPPPSVVRWARASLRIGGIIWFLFAVLTLFHADGDITTMLWGIAMVVVAILHFAVARYGGKRGVVFLSFFGP